jgi:hypothetical protein
MQNTQATVCGIYHSFAEISALVSPVWGMAARAGQPLIAQSETTQRETAGRQHQAITYNFEKAFFQSQQRNANERK